MLFGISRFVSCSRMMSLNTALSKVYQLCDKAVSKGIFHKNTAARKKSRLALAVKKLAK